MGIPGEVSEQGIENLFEVVTGNFPNLVKEKRHTSPGSSDPKRPVPRHIIQ